MNKLYCEIMIMSLNVITCMYEMIRGHSNGTGQLLEVNLLK